MNSSFQIVPKQKPYCEYVQNKSASINPAAGTEVHLALKKNPHRRYFPCSHTKHVFDVLLILTHVSKTSKLWSHLPP